MNTGWRVAVLLGPPTASGCVDPAMPTCVGSVSISSMDKRVAFILPPCLDCLREAARVSAPCFDNRKLFS